MDEDKVQSVSGDSVPLILPESRYSQRLLLSSFINQLRLHSRSRQDSIIVIHALISAWLVSCPDSHRVTKVGNLCSCFQRAMTSEFDRFRAFSRLICTTR